MSNSRAPPALRRGAALGFDQHQLTDFVLTHHHRDHVDGLADFPWARVHASDECRAAIAEGTAGTMPAQWAHGVNWAPAPTRSADWHGFSTSRPHGLPDSIRLVRLAGHSPGHSGVLLDDPALDHPILHVGDAIHHCGQLTGNATDAVEAFARSSQHDEAQRLDTIRALGQIASAGTARVINAHDPAAGLAI